MFADAGETLGTAIFGLNGGRWAREICGINLSFLT